MQVLFKLFTDKLVLACILAAIFSGCSSFDLIPTDSLIQRLKDRGPVLVSPDNSYLAANLLLDQESKTSNEMAGFLESKGLPSALSVSQDFLQPAKIKMYYSKGQEEYNLELLQGIWIIDGPKKINDPKIIELISTNSADIQNSEIQSKNESTEMVPLFEENNKGPPALALKSEPQNSEIESIISKYGNIPAETTPKGDVVHYVTADNETLEIISYWYTKTEHTASRIARINKLAPSAILRPGDQIVIPAELAKNKLRLGEDAVTELVRP